jgi:muramoyltetrapeptide carboxypeptidase LdcA involved in peptidoglycan recycling
MRSSTLSLFSSLLLACLVGGQSQWTRPPAVMTGDAIRIVATGGAVSAASLSSGVSYLNSTYGLLVRQNDTVLSVDLYYAGSDTTRASGVLQALSEPDTKVVWAARGRVALSYFCL